VEEGKGKKGSSTSPVVLRCICRRIQRSVLRRWWYRKLTAPRGLLKADRVRGRHWDEADGRMMYAAIHHALGGGGFGHWGQAPYPTNEGRGADLHHGDVGGPRGGRRGHRGGRRRRREDGRRCQGGVGGRTQCSDKTLLRNSAPNSSTRVKRGTRGLQESGCLGV